MKEERPLERIPPVLPGDEVLRRRRKPRRRLRIVPSVPAVFMFFKDIATQTPLLPILSGLLVLLLLFSAGVYFAERASNESINSFGEALWWSVSAMQTMGFNAPGPITSLGRIIGGVWAILGTIGFFGAIIASVTAYFMLPKRRLTRQIINTIQYNLGQLEDLSVEELKTLKETTVGLIEAQMERLKERPSPGR